LSQSKNTPPQTTTEKDVTVKDWLAFMSMVFGMFMAILDIQIVASSLNEIGAGVSATNEEISWVQTSYLIAEVIMIPLTGFLSRLLSTRILFTMSVIGFSLSSLLCALSWDINSMIVFRALQGFIGGAMIPTVFATSFLMFPDSKRVTVSVAIGLVATMAPTLGPTIGGYLTQTFTWHWLFLVNVVPGFVVAIIVWRLVNIDKPDKKLLEGFDFIGVSFLSLSLGSLQYVLEEGNRKDWFGSNIIVTFTIISAGSGLIFLWRALTYEKPIVDLTAYKSVNFTIGSFYSFVLGVGLYGSVFLLPLFLGEIRGYNSLQIGLLMIVTGAFQFVSSPLAGFVSKILDLRLMLFLGLSCFAMGVYLNSSLTSEAGFWEFFLPQAFRGLALMFCFLPINNVSLGTLPQHQVKNASGLYNLMRNLGGAIGLSVLNTMLTQRTKMHYQYISEKVNTSRHLVIDQFNTLTSQLSAIPPGKDLMVATKYLSMIVQKEAAVMAFNDCFILITCIFSFSLLLTPFLQKPQLAIEGGH
jgi:DHA2 family multidrug resistance protein